MKWQGRGVLVTGAGGFIGSHLVEELVERGADVTALVKYNSRSDPGNLRFLDDGVRKEVEILFGDVRDPYLMRRATASKEVVFHLAALIGIPYSYHASASYVETNVLGTLHVLQASRDAEVSRILHTSTSEVYGTARHVPMDEAHPLQAQSPYAASKIGADKLAESFHASFGLPVSTVRPFNTFGPRQSARAIIPTVLRQLEEGVPALKLGSLDPVRDFTFVKDTVRGFLAIAECEATVGEVTNVGSGREISIGQLVDLCCELVGHRPTVVTEEERVRPEKSEVMRLLCDNEKVKNLTDWSPEVTLRDGLAATLRFVREEGSMHDPRRYLV